MNFLPTTICSRPSIRNEGMKEKWNRRIVIEKKWNRFPIWYGRKIRLGLWVFIVCSWEAWGRGLNVFFIVFVFGNRGGLVVVRWSLRPYTFLVKSFVKIRTRRHGEKMWSPTVGLEPTTTRLRALRSTNWARRAFCLEVYFITLIGKSRLSDIAYVHIFYERNNDFFY